MAFVQNYVHLYFGTVQKYEENTLTLLRTETSESPLASCVCAAVKFCNKS